MSVVANGVVVAVTAKHGFKEEPNTKKVACELSVGDRRRRLGTHVARGTQGVRCQTFGGTDATYFGQNVQSYSTKLGVFIKQHTSNAVHGNSLDLVLKCVLHFS